MYRRKFDTCDDDQDYILDVSSAIFLKVPNIQANIRMTSLFCRHHSHSPFLIGSNPFLSGTNELNL